MNMTVADMFDFVDLPDLALEDLGGAVLVANDEFFAEKENLLRARPAEWKEHVYTDRGKWMDGWETRRRREPGYDWCVVRLGLPGIIKGVIVDTAYFRGNYPESCSIEATEIADTLDLGALAGAAWTEILPRSPLSGDTRNKFAIAADRRFTHVRLNIYPDGGVARLRIHGQVVPDLRRLHGGGGWVDLAALEHGAWVEGCSDMFFGSRGNLIKPGPSHSMADGWETRRRREPGNDWALIRLAAPGTVERIELDTSHFKGNAPGRAVIEGWIGEEQPQPAGDAHAAWRTLIATRTQPHTRHVFDDELRRIGVVSHVRLSVFPDGGVARLRVWGTLVPPPTPGLAKLNAMSAAEATAALVRCCGSSNWAAEMTASRPFADVASLLAAADRRWWQLEEADWLEAFAAHPPIGDKEGSAWSRDEQRGTTAITDAIAGELRSANQAYRERHGFVFLICATGKSAAEMLDVLRARIPAAHADEVRTAAEEQAKITRLRLAKLLAELA
jgi:allantoicase